MVRLFGRPRLRRAVVGNGEAADASDARAISRIFPITCIRLEHRHRLADPTRWPGDSAPPSSSRFMARRISTPLERFEATGISAARFRWAIRSPVRAWVGGFFYPGSRYGESEYLFGSRVGVRPNPRVSATGGLTVTF